METVTRILSILQLLCCNRAFYYVKISHRFLTAKLNYDAIIDLNFVVSGRGNLAVSYDVDFKGNIHIMYDCKLLIN